jgi:hypothetical protein
MSTRPGLAPGVDEMHRPPSPTPSMPPLTFARGYARHRSRRNAVGASPVCSFTRREKW